MPQRYPRLPVQQSPTISILETIRQTVYAPEVKDFLGRFSYVSVAGDSVLVSFKEDVGFSSRAGLVVLRQITKPILAMGFQKVLVMEPRTKFTCELEFTDGIVWKMAEQPVI